MRARPDDIGHAPPREQIGNSSATIASSGAALHLGQEVRPHDLQTLLFGLGLAFSALSAWSFRCVWMTRRSQRRVAGFRSLRAISQIPAGAGTHALKGQDRRRHLSACEITCVRVHGRACRRPSRRPAVAQARQDLAAQAGIALEARALSGPCTRLPLGVARLVADLPVSLAFSSRETVEASDPELPRFARCRCHGPKVGQSRIDRQARAVVSPTHGNTST